MKFILIPILLFSSLAYGVDKNYVAPKNRGNLTLLNSTTNQTQVYTLRKLEMVLTQKGYNLSVIGSADINGEKKAGKCVIQSFKTDTIFPLYKALYESFLNSSSVDVNIKCTTKSFEGPAMVLLDIGEGDLRIEHL
ncbi:MAG: hypothetical protein ACO20H_09005 [Bacteriovoracaceae bacterium]